MRQELRDANADWLLPQWPAPARVGAVCTTRNGGESGGAYASLNLGLHVGDSEAVVLRNRARLAHAMGVRPVFLDQVHGIHHVVVTATTPDGQVADVASTKQAGVACVVMVADCLPVLFCNRDGTQVAAAHAGWRGLLGAQTANAAPSPQPPPASLGVLEVAVQEMTGGQERAQDILAWLGPCIGPTAFEVGSEVRDAFVALQPGAAQFFQACGADKWLADLAGLARARLQRLGVSEISGNDSSAPWCTASNPSSFFSHRRDRISGRQAAAIWIRP